MTKILCSMLILAASSATAQPRVTNGDLRPASFSGAFTRAVLESLTAKSATAWIAYAVPMLEGDHSICDGMHYNGSGITNRTGSSSVVQPAQPPVMMLEGPRVLHVLYRAEAGRIDRIRIASEDCTLDAGGLTVQWLANVAPADSVTVLTSFLSESTPRRLADGALTALAMHREPAALERLLASARSGATSHLRGQALFWLAQRAGAKAVGAISDAIANDPETDVKKRAVFALSQLPKDEGVPKLIEVARTNANPAVRKQAMFWLGQSRDPRAVRFFEEVLFK